MARNVKIIGSLLWQSIRRAGLEKQVGASLVIEEFRKVLIRNFGQKILNKVKILHLKKKMLTLSVTSSIIAQEIKLNEKKFLKEINEELGRKLVDEIRFLSR